MSNVSIIEKSACDSTIKIFEKMLKFWEPINFFVDFVGDSISCYPQKESLKILLIQDKKENILGGAVLGKGVSLNEFEDMEKTKKVENYMQNNFYNLSYFYINTQYRRNGYGSQLLEYVGNNYQNIWLSAEEKLLPFYLKNGYKIIIPACNSKEHTLLYSS